VDETTDPYSEHSETVEAVLAHIRRRHLLSPDAGDEFSSWARLRLIENDYAILRKFRGDSSIRTFLTTVLLRLFLDKRNLDWGRWRPTALARRLGPVAIELERCVLRDGRPYDEAVEFLISTQAGVTRAECDDTWAQLKRLPVRKMTTTEVLVEVPVPDNPHARIDFTGAGDRATRIGDALRGAIRQLADQDQIILRLNYLQKFTAKEIGNALDLEAKPLYRRIEQIQAKLGGFLQSAGLTKDETLGIFDNPDIDLGEILDEELRKPEPGPSIRKNAGGGV